MGNRLIKILDKSLDTVIVIVCILLLLIGTYSLMDNHWLYENATDRSSLTYKPALDEPLQEEKRISENQIAWITVNDTDIDYPVMQGKDNYEYLNKDPYGEFSLSGSIFLDARNDPDFKDDYSLIYGHHMEKGAMFGALDDFQDRAYFDQRRSGTIMTDERSYELRLFAVCSAEANETVLFDPQGRTISEVLAFLRGKAIIYNEPTEGERIVALSTCSGGTSIMRLLVFGTIHER